MLNCSFLPRVGEFLIYRTNEHPGSLQGRSSDDVGPFPPATNMSPGLRSNRSFSGDPQYASGRKCTSISKIDQLQKIYHFSHSPTQPPKETVQFTSTQMLGPTGAYGEKEKPSKRTQHERLQEMMPVCCIHGCGFHAASEPRTLGLTCFPMNLCKTHTGAE